MPLLAIDGFSNIDQFGLPSRIQDSKPKINKNGWPFGKVLLRKLKKLIEFLYVFFKGSSYNMGVILAFLEGKLCRLSRQARPKTLKKSASKFHPFYWMKSKVTARSFQFLRWKISHLEWQSCFKQGTRDISIRSLDARVPFL